MLIPKQKTVEFNPANAAHRSAVASFMKRNAWVDSPIRFVDDPEYGSVPDQVKTRLLQWYMDQEAKKRVKVKPKVNIVLTRTNHAS